jgi:hypothetical protein
MARFCAGFFNHRGRSRNKSRNSPGRRAGYQRRDHPNLEAKDAPRSRRLHDAGWRALCRVSEQPTRLAFGQGIHRAYSSLIATRPLPYAAHHQSTRSLSAANSDPVLAYERPLCVESRCGVVALGRTYLLPPLSSGGALVVPPWLVFTSSRPVQSLSARPWFSLTERPGR